MSVWTADKGSLVRGKSGGAGSGGGATNGREGRLERAVEVLRKEVSWIGFWDERDGMMGC